jgi:hypothetical protein
MLSGLAHVGSLFRQPCMSTRTLPQQFNMGKVDLPGIVSAELRAIKMAIAAMDAPAIKGCLA